MSKRNASLLAAGIILVLIVIDQLIKIYIKTHFALGEEVSVFGLDWWRIKFIENEGMAFGFELGPKFFLTLFRIVATGALFWYMWRWIKQGVKVGFLITLCVIIAGAIGNIIDCLFYGLIFNDSTPSTVATLVPFGEGYGTVLNGRVVDMFYFPLFEFDWPTWMPFVGGSHFQFFNAIFNFADACITCGVFTFILFYRHVLSSKQSADEGGNSPDGMQ